ncbi:MAG: hypothetical protein SFW36_09605 [Leptolyngbyaceae cyanobacterium bins.59]|nr:hypothetical protein [Leptolyngbyaceae cyanobacterium bins.59]
MSAVLFHRPTGQFYPIQWQEPAFPEAPVSFRLPTALSLDLPTPQRMDPTPAVLGPIALAQALEDPRTLQPGLSSALILQHFKAYLRSGITHRSSHTQTWEPILQWSDRHAVSMHQLQQSLQALIATLRQPPYPARLGSAPLNVVTCSAPGLDLESFQRAIEQLAGVIVNYPVNWSDTYSFNVREAILKARLVPHPDQICCIEDPIAAVLSTLRPTVAPEASLALAMPRSTSFPQGETLVISAGATTTDLAFVNLPDDLTDLGYRDFIFRSFPYAGDALDQDIVSQLLYPALAARRSHSSSSPVQRSGSYLYGDEHLPWDELDLQNWPLPRLADADWKTRIRLRQRLAASALGRSLIEAASYLKVILQHQDRFDLQLGYERWTVTRRDLESKVFLPYLQRLNRELNALTTRIGIAPPAIRQVICTGGTASLPAIGRWLNQKLPQATIVQDTYLQSSTTPSTCSRIAYGLATLPLYPQVLDLARHQYSDYFLLLEVLRAFPDQSVSAVDFMQRLEKRGINTHVCHLHILAILEGHLPPGLVPLEREMTLWHPDSYQNPDYQALTTEPLFYKEGSLYRPNPSQCSRLQLYLDRILEQTQQRLEEPLAERVRMG